MIISFGIWIKQTKDNQHFSSRLGRLATIKKEQQKAEKEHL